MTRWNVSLAAGSHQHSCGPRSGRLADPADVGAVPYVLPGLSRAGASRDPTAGWGCHLRGAPRDPAFLPASALYFGFGHISTGAGPWRGVLERNVQATL